ncbi:MAG: hypothetical protein ABW223_03945, partial [Rariglobus sp.]
MPLLSAIGNKTWSQKFFVWFLYGTLSIFGASMAVPFLIMLTSSVSNPFDYDRYSILPRSLWSATDRFMKGVPNFTTPDRGIFPDAPTHWTSWRAIGLDTKGVDNLANQYLKASEADLARWRVQAADYSDFALTYPLEDTVATFTNEDASTLTLRRYVELATARDPAVATLRRSQREQAALALLSENWGVPIENYISIRFDRERRAPIGQQSWVPPSNGKWADYNALRHAIQHGVNTPGVLPAWEDFLKARNYSKADIERLTPLPLTASEADRSLWREFARADAPLTPVTPFSLRPVWLAYLNSDESRKLLSLDDDSRFDIALYNRLAGTNYTALDETPFPLPAGTNGLRPLWDRFIETQYPLRLTTLDLTPALRAKYTAFLDATYKQVPVLNKLLGSDYSDWSQVPLAASMPSGNPDGSPSLREVWVSFVKALPAVERKTGSADAAYQAYLKNKYTTLDAVNAAYGWKLVQWEEARFPLDKAYAITYGHHQ